MNLQALVLLAFDGRVQREQLDQVHRAVDVRARRRSCPPRLLRSRWPANSAPSCVLRSMAVARGQAVAARGDAPAGLYAAAVLAPTPAFGALHAHARYHAARSPAASGRARTHRRIARARHVRSDMGGDLVVLVGEPVARRLRRRLPGGRGVALRIGRLPPVRTVAFSTSISVIEGRRGGWCLPVSPVGGSLCS